VGDKAKEEREYRLIVFTWWPIVIEARFKVRRTRWFFMQW